MGKTAIGWCRNADGTEGKVWNPVVGCTKVSQGCKNCYAKTIHDMRRQARQEGKNLPPQYDKPFETIQLLPERLDIPLRWKTPQRIFVNSVSDLFHPDVPFAFIASVFGVMAACPDHTFMILTKRPKRMLEWFQWILTANNKLFPYGVPGSWSIDSNIVLQFVPSSINISEDEPAPSWPLPNVCLGVSVENQQAGDERIQDLLKTPAACRFLSCEPLLGSIDLHQSLGQFSNCPECGYGVDVDEDGLCNSCGRDVLQYGIDWVIAGGESGANARPMHVDWARSLRDQCQKAGVPFFFKQWGEFIHETQIYEPVDGPDSVVLNHAADEFMMTAPGFPEKLAYQWPDTSISYRVGKRAAGHVLDGKIWDEFPTIQ